MKISVRRAIALQFLVPVVAAQLVSTPPLAANDRELAQEIDSLFADLDSVKSPGCALGVIRDGDLVYRRGYGMASLEHGLPIDERTVFYTGSVSKQFVAAAVAMAAREGHLSLDDGVRRWFPELPSYAEPITVRHLVHHTSGLRDYLGLMSLAGVPFENVITPESVLALIARQKAPNFAPGERYLYSNSGYFLLAQLIGRATGRSLREYAQEKLFAPLEMDHTHFHDDRREVVSNRALGYSASEGHFVVNWSPAFDQVGSGGLLSTIEDLVEWDRSYYDGRLGEGFWDALLVRGKLENGTELQYAFGLNVDEYGEGHRRIQHGGAMFGYRAQLTRFPEQRLAIAVLCNLASANPGRRANQVADLFLSQTQRAEDETGEASGSEDADAMEGLRLSANELDAWVGEYGILPGITLIFVRDGDGLLLTTPDGNSWSVVAISPTELRIRAVEPPITDPEVRLNSDSDPPSLTVELYGQETTAPRLTSLTDDSGDLQAWVGSYWSEELAAIAKLAMADGKLTYQIGSSEARELRARGDWSFSWPGMRAQGELGRDGKIAAFVIDAGRVQGIRFERER